MTEAKPQSFPLYFLYFSLAGDSLKTLGLIAFLLLTPCAAFSQAQTTDAPAIQQSTPAIDPKLHASVLKLVEVMGAHKSILAAQTAAMPKIRETLLKGPPMITEELADAWEKRMLSDSSIDTYVNVIVSVYEKYFTEAEIEELIQFQKDKLDQKTPVLSDALKAKLTKDGIAMQSEIIGGCTQVGARMGGETEQQLMKDHPEWVKSADASGEKKTN
ncbi:MAG TPA: hypothetical protein VL346_08745 [Acidobacteriaceae bacterium]|nr:hypothetical protein [Acidobacteriaceae bacterium]